MLSLPRHTSVLAGRQWLAAGFGCALLATAPVVSATPSPTAARRWTFEQPAYGSQTSNTADHCYVLDQGVWHLFYTHIPTVEQPGRYIGHASSPDLREWTEFPPVLVADGSAPEWRQIGVWAPHVERDPVAGGFVMAYTGVSQMSAQRIGFLRSTDLMTWQEVAAPPFEPAPEHYRWNPNDYSSCRDPHLMRAGGLWHMVYAARSSDSTAAIGYATSADLLTWQQLPPLMVMGAPGGWPDMESPGLIPFGTRYLMFYSYQGVRISRANALEGPWPGDESMQVDPIGSAGELVPNGSGLFLSRRRSDPCRPGHSVVWTDSLDVAVWPYHTAAWERLGGWIEESGDAFASQPTFGDGAEARGETPAQPTHLFMLSSRESHPEPNVGITCSFERGGTPTGHLRSAPFVLEADTAAVRIGGAASPDSAYVRLRDACTNRVFAAFTGGSATLERKIAYVGGAMGGEVEWLVRDALTRPGGWLEIDDLEVYPSEGAPTVAAPPPIGWVFPVGGENVQPRDRLNISWSGAGATLDSLELYLTYDDGASLKLLNRFDGSKSTTKWTVPDTVALDVRLRIVAYAHNGARDCATTGTFTIGGSTDAELPGAAGRGGLRVRYAAGTAWLEGQAPAAAPGEMARLELFDLRGRRLAEVWRGVAGASFRVSVPPFGDGGRAIGSGIVFARLRVGAETRIATVYVPPRE